MSIKSLAGQTMWYGMSTIIGRFINYLTTPIIAILATSIQGQAAAIYGAIAFLNIFFTFGMETTFFRFSRDEDVDKVYNTSFTTILLIGLPLTALMILFREKLAVLFSVPDQPNLVIIAAFIVLIDALASMPFAKLRHDQRPRKFALVKILSIVVNVFLVIFFIQICPWLVKNDIASGAMSWFSLDHALSYIFIANLLASFSALLFLSVQLKNFRLKIDKELWTKMLVYTLPLVIVGLGGTINEVFDRVMLPNLLPGDFETRTTQSGIYVQNFKLAALILIFIQAFRMGAEPFFIKQSTKENAPQAYARIMNFFVMICCFGALIVLMFYDIWKFYIRADLFPERQEGFVIVPILLLAKILLGIYYNLSIWFKLENKTHYGAVITIIGAIITLSINFYFIPIFGYISCAWAALACYSFMIVASYYYGNKYYPVPYQISKIFVYLIITFGLYYLQSTFIHLIDSPSLRIGIGILFILVFCVFALIFDKKEFAHLPLIGKYVSRL